MTHHLSPEGMEAYLVSEFLGFGTGLALSVMLLRLLRRGAGQRSGAHARYYQAASALMWNLGGLLGSLVSLLGMPARSVLMVTAAVLHISGAAFFPPAFLAMWRKPSDEQSGRAKACRFLFRISTLSAVILTMSFIATLRMPLPPPGGHQLFGNLIGKVLAWHVAVVTGLGVWLLLQGRLNDFISRFYAVTTLIGASAPAVLTVMVIPSDLSAPLQLALCIVKHQSPQLILLGAIVFFADFRFSNVYVKSSLQLLTALSVALGCCLLILGPLPRLVHQMTDYPTAGLVCAATALLVLLFWAFVRINPILTRLVDGWLFREPDYSAAMRHVWKEISRQGGVEHDRTDEHERIFNKVTHFVRETLELEEVRVIPISAVDADHLAATLNSGEVCELSFDDPTKLKLGAGVEFLAPVRVKGEPTHLLAIHPGSQRRHLLESEIGFVRAVAGQISSRLEALQIEKERADRQSKEERLRRQVSEAELRALRAQINPHFLFNSLNTIADLIVANPARAERMTVQLARVFRHVLSNTDRQMITVDEELEFLRNYLEIEVERFGERLSVRMDVDATAATENVPSLILQPVVENALKHGLAQKVGCGTLQISVKLEDSFLRLTVEDDGPGFSPGTPAAPIGLEDGYFSHKLFHPRKRESQGVGLRNITERLATIYSGQAKILLEPGSGGGSRITLMLPRLERLVTDAA